MRREKGERLNGLDDGLRPGYEEFQDHLIGMGGGGKSEKGSETGTFHWVSTRSKTNNG